ncbi:hypothetical protein Tco_0341555 [Tanacetum coccineum]
METYSCEFCGGIPHPGFDCQTGNMPVYDQGPCYNQDFGYDQPPFYSPSQPQQFDCYEFCGGPHYSSDCQTRNPLVYEPNPGYNSYFPYIDQPPQYNIDQSLPLDPYFQKNTEESDDVSEVIFDEEKFQDNKVLLPSHLRHLHTYPPTFLSYHGTFRHLLIGDEVISTTPARENDEFIKSSVDDLFPIPRESEVTLVSTYLECSMPIDSPPLPCTDVLRDKKVDIDLPFGEHLDTLSTGDRETNFNPSDLETIDPVPDPRMFDVPLGNDDSISRYFDVTISNPLFDFDDNYSLIIDNKIFDDDSKDLCSLDPLRSIPLIDESILLVTPLPDPKQICSREVERFDPFFSLTQSGDMTWVMERPFYRFHHMPLPRQVAYSPKVVMYRYFHPNLILNDGLSLNLEIPFDESKEHIEVSSVLWENRLPIPDGSLPLSSSCQANDGGLPSSANDVGEVVTHLLTVVSM